MKTLLIILFCLYFVIESKHFYHHSSRFFRSQICESESYIKHILCGEYERESTEMCTKLQLAEWNHVTDIKNKSKADKFINLTLASACLARKYWKNYFRDVDPKMLSSSNLKRQMCKLSVLGTDILDDDRLEEFTTIKSEMAEIYSTAKICPYARPKCNLTKDGIPYDPDIVGIMANSRDYDELLYTWVSWRDATGPKVKRKYLAYVELGNVAAKLNNFSDRGEMWRNEYESPNLEEDLEKIWEEVAPLYNELHLYALTKLREQYQQELETDYDELIPAHLLGNMWGQTWIGLQKILKPFPRYPDVDMDEILEKNNITVIQMFDMANDFFTSMGLHSMEKAYDEKEGAIIEKPRNVSMVCHASAWDFCDGRNFRIKMCAQVTHENFITIHHEMGHIQYFMQYAHLPYTYRNGANPGFHEAIGDTIALSVSSPAHLERIGLLPQNRYNHRKEVIINTLMDMALERVAFLPFAYLLEKWRWDIFAHKVDPDQWNEHYWHYKEKYQRVKAPLPRTDEDFDPGSKFHIASDSQYISYFIAHILEFQIFRSLCQQSGRYIPDDINRPLHRCDLYQSTVAGKKLREGLALGASKHWSYVLERITGERKLSGSALIEYFKPLYEYLVVKNTPCGKK